MNVKIKILTALVLSGMLVACASEREMVPHNWALDVQNAETKEAHLKLADHYEEIAKTMDVDAEEERLMLREYEAKPFKYGKQILDLKARAHGMINHFEKAASDSRKMAEYHRQFASESR